MPPTEQITWLFVEDLERSTRFYVEALGLRRVLDQPTCRILGLSDTAFLGLCERQPPRETPGLLLCFVVSDVTAAWRRLLDAGAREDQAPRIHPTYQIEHAFVWDPDGHRVEVQRFLDPDWKSGHR